MTLYEELESHINDVMFASWFNFSRQESVCVERHAVKNPKTNDIIAMDILPRDLRIYKERGLGEYDLILIWIDDDKFIPVLFKWYNHLFDECVDEGSVIPNKQMYEKISTFIKERMKMCGIDE